MNFKKEVNVDDGNIACDKDISHLNTLGLQSQASAYAKFNDINQLLNIFNFAIEHCLPVLPIGEGSNVVLSRQLHALVLHTQNKGIKVLSEQKTFVDVRVAAGENWHEFVNHCVKNHWYGLENLALIPGCVGAAPIQNIGAYGVEVSSSILSVHTIVLPDINSPVVEGNLLEKLSFKNEECKFSYRDSVFKKALRDKLVITHVDFRLNKQFVPNIDYPSLRNHLSLNSISSKLTASNIFDAVCNIRQSKLPDPKKLPNAGSFFKNIEINKDTFITFKQDNPDAPYFEQEGGSDNQTSVYKIPSAWLIEQCGFKGWCEGNLGMHVKQALVLVNHNNMDLVKASGEDVLRFAQRIQTTVMEKYNLALEIEPRFY